MSFSSFYGGRTGASFVIKKHFDGINIPPNTRFRKKYCAYMIDENDNEKYYYVDNNGLIQRTANNYTEYAWEIITFSSAAYPDPINTIHYSTGIKGTLTIEDEYAEGMVQCFKKGGASTNEVNYEEYVIIDTIIGLSDYNDPDNGKIFRRGMDFLAEDGGAIYIGQIVGPQGATAEISMDSYNTISAQGDSKTGEYTPTDGLVPGKYKEGGITKFNDNIKYASVVLKDENGNVVGAEIGFEFPYLVNDFYSELISPYDSHGDVLPRVTDLITPIDDGSNHPFYKQWKVSIPRGTKGDRVSNLKLNPTKSRPGCSYWNSATLAGDPAGTLQNACDVITVEQNYLAVSYNDGTVYIKPEDGWKVELKYTITNYDNKQAGESTNYSMGYYDVVDKLTLDQNGIITVWYSSRNPDVLAGTPLTWINNVSINQQGHFEITYNNNAVSGGTYSTDLLWIDDVAINNLDGTISFYYNDGTLAYSKPNYIKFINDVIIDDQDGTITFYYNDGTVAYTKSNYLTFVNNVNLTTDGDITFTRNDGSIAFTEDNFFTFVKDVDITADGTITFSRNDGTIAFVEQKYLKVINDITIDTNGSGNEGDGDQKIHVTYNTDNAGTSHSIGNPINYIMEAVVTGSDHLTKPFHLFVRYSDPVRRAVNPESYNGKNDWTDLGYVRGIAEGLRIITNVDSEDDLYEGPGHTNPIKPEDWASQTGDPVANTTGWGITVGQEGEQDIFVFDYINNIWESIGSVSKVDATKIIQVSETLPATLGKNGVWVRTEKVLYAN